MIYTKIEQPTHAMTEVVIKIMAELISILALATKQMKERKLSKCLLSDTHPWLNYCRKICEEALGR